MKKGTDERVELGGGETVVAVLRNAQTGEARVIKAPWYRIIAGKVAPYVAMVVIIPIALVVLIIKFIFRRIFT